MTTCVNCDKEINGNFCSNCAQRAGVKRITFREGWNDFWARIYGFDGMFPNTLRDLTLRPGVAALSFISGNRVKYYGPVGYFFLMVTLFLLALSMLNISFYDFILSKGITKETMTGEGQKKFMKLFSDWMTENMRLFSFGMIPCIALTSKLFFRKSGLNFLEHAVLPFYIQGHIYWVSILSLVIFKISGYAQLNFYAPVLTFFLFGLGYSQLMNYQSRTKAFVKGILASITGFMLFMILFTLVGFLIILMDPDYFEMLKPSNNH